MVKNPPANAEDKRDQDSIPGSGRSAGEGIGYPLQYSCASLVAQLGKTTNQICFPGGSVIKNLPVMQEMQKTGV